MKDLEQTLSKCVLRAISDDYENFAKIMQDVIVWASEQGLNADAQSTQKALEGLINNGYVQPYCLSAGPPGKAEARWYSADSLDELWFYLTPKGQQYVKELMKEWTQQ